MSGAEKSPVKKERSVPWSPGLPRVFLPPPRLLCLCKGAIFLISKPSIAMGWQAVLCPRRQASCHPPPVLLELTVSFQLPGAIARGQQGGHSVK